MDKTYEKFLRSGMDLAAVGIECCRENTQYFCTPKGASVFGWAGTDGIHFCFIRGFGGMVFSVNPMNESQSYVHPLAKDFSDFLRLLLACGNEAALEQAWRWSREEFEAFLLKNPAAGEGEKTLKELAKAMKLTPMEQPWEYIRKLQSDFDYSRIKYTEDYYDIDRNPSAEIAFPEWKVYFDGNFWGHHGRAHAGKEIRIHKELDWAGYHWVIPSVYSCSKGLVIDFCMQADIERIRGFMEKWSLSSDNDFWEDFTREQQLQIELDNPLCFHFTPRILLNGKELLTSHGCSVCYNPCLPERCMQDLETKWAMDHYGLDYDCGWVICRNAFPWAGRRRPVIKKLSVTMEQQSVQIPGPHFKIHEPGESFPFYNPVSKMSHTLTVESMEQEILSRDSFGSKRWIYPTNCMVMNYRISPEPENRITIFDCDEGDQPLEKKPEENAFYPAAKQAICIIGGAGGPAEIIMGDDSRSYLRTAYSALHFEPVREDVEWHMVFHTKQFGEESFLLLEQGFCGNSTGRDSEGEHSDADDGI